MSMHNKACNDRIPNCLRIRDCQLSSVTKDQKHQKKLKTVVTADKIRLSFLDVKGSLYSKLMPTAQLWLVKHQESWNYDCDFTILDHSTYCPNLALSDFFLYFPKWSNILKNHIIHQTMKSKQQFGCSSIIKMRMSIKTDLWNCSNIGRSVYSIKTIKCRSRYTKVNHEVQEVIHFDFIQISVTTCT